MSLFSESRNFSIDGSSIQNFHGHQFNFLGPANVEGGSVFNERRGLSLTTEDVIPEEELQRSSGYRVHAARMGSRLVVMKVFHGFCARKSWAQTIAFCRRLMHPRLMHMIGSSRPDQDVHFIVFDGGFRRRMERLVASALRDNLTRSVILGLKMIHGISSALSYLSDENIPLLSIGIENFEIFVGGEDRIVIGINPTGLHENMISTPNLTNHDHGEMIVLNTLCLKTFTAVNQVLYREQLDRSSSSEPTPSRHLEVYTEQVNRFPETTEQQNTEVSPGLTKPVPRREFVWRFHQQDGSSLREVSEQFGDFIAVFLPSSTLPLRRFRARGVAPTPHRCVGYSREEINLSTNISTSVVVSHATPAPLEICLICGEIVQEEEIFECICGKEDDSLRSNIKCDTCSVWQHRDCVISTGPSAHHFTCSTCVRNASQHPPHSHNLQHTEVDDTHPAHLSSIDENSQRSPNPLFTTDTESATLSSSDPQNGDNPNVTSTSNVAPGTIPTVTKRPRRKVSLTGQLKEPTSFEPPSFTPEQDHTLNTERPINGVPGSPPPDPPTVLRRALAEASRVLFGSSPTDIPSNAQATKESLNRLRSDQSRLPHTQLPEKHSPADISSGPGDSKRFGAKPTTPASSIDVHPLSTTATPAEFEVNGNTSKRNAFKRINKLQTDETRGVVEGSSSASPNSPTSPQFRGKRRKAAGISPLMKFPSVHVDGEIEMKGWKESKGRARSKAAEIEEKIKKFSPDFRFSSSYIAPTLDSAVLSPGIPSARPASQYPSVRGHGNHGPYTISDDTDAYDGWSTGALADDEADPEYKAEIKAAQILQNQMEELEFRAARQQLAHVDLRPPKSWNPVKAG